MTYRRVSERARVGIIPDFGLGSDSGNRALPGAACLVLGLLVAVSLAIGAGCERAGADEGAAATAATATPLKWREDIGPALAHAKVNAQPVLIDFTADWCAPCQELEEKTFPDSDVQAFLDDNSFVLVKQDGSDSIEGIETMMTRFGVESFPTLVILDKNGVVVAKTLDFVAPEDLLDSLALAVPDAGKPVDGAPTE